MQSIGRAQLETALRALGELLITHDPSPGYRSVLVDMLRQLGFEDADASLG